MFIPETGSAAQDREAARYGCPSWSPDGRLVASFVDTGSSHYLAILPLESGKARFWEINTPVGGPVWTPDSSRVVLAHEVRGGRPPEVLAVNLSPKTGRPLSESVLRASNQWGSIGGLAVSPDGWQVVLLSSSILRDSRALAVLRRFSLHSTADRSPVSLEAGSLRVPPGQGSLAWLPDDGLGLVLHNSSEERYKAVIQRYDLLQRRLETLTQVEDQLYSAAWSPDGRWVVYSTESGLWALDIELARNGQAAPVWISPQPVFDMDWR
jgi:Tol biopolymer transport system component